jgi:hypothetical protein
MARKTHKDHKKEYSLALLKLSSVQARIHQRAEELCRLHPDVPIGWGATGKDIEKLPLSLETEDYLSIIKHIEDYNEQQSNIKQGKLFN